VSTAGPRLGGCSWRRCQHQASRGYCDHHAAQAAEQPGAVLTGTVGRVPVQQALPGLDGAAQDAGVAWQGPPRGGAR
jgi:hypothetical protein